jgi:hypothetical protein
MQIVPDEGRTRIPQRCESNVQQSSMWVRVILWFKRLAWLKVN